MHLGFTDEVAAWIMQHVPQDALSQVGSNPDPFTRGHSYSAISVRAWPLSSFLCLTVSMFLSRRR